MNSPQSPQVNVIIPAHDAARYLSIAIESVMAQTFQDWSIVLVNDGSTDATPQIMDRMARENARVRVVHNERNLGLGGAYKRAVQFASKKYVMWVSGDNAETPGNIANIISHVGEWQSTTGVLVPRPH